MDEAFEVYICLGEAFRRDYEEGMEEEKIY